MIVAYSRSDGAATNYEIAWVTMALQHLRVGDDGPGWTRRIWTRTGGCGPT